MVRKKLKHYVQLGILLLGIPLLLISCEKEITEDVEVLQQQGSKFSVTTLNSKAVEADSELSHQLERFNNIKTKDNSSLASREIYNEDYGFTINTDYVKRIEDTETGNHSFSFPIVRDTPLTEHLENLLLHANAEGGYDTYIVEYDFTAEEYAVFDETSSTNFQTILTPIDFDTNVFNDGELAKTVYVCHEVWTWGIIDDGDQGELVGADNAEQFTLGWMLTGISCGYVDDGTGNEATLPDSTSSTHGGVGTGTGTDPNNNPDPTDPNNHNGNNNVVIAAPTTVSNNPNIQRLNSLTSSTQVKAKIAELRTKLNENREYGYQFNISGNNPVTYNITAGILDSDNRGIKFENPSIFTKLQMHNHYEGLDSAFSSEDLFNTTRSGYNSSNDDMTAILVAPNGKIYALRIDNLELAGDFASNYTNSDGEASEEKFIKMQSHYDTYIVDPANDTCGGTCSDEQYDNLLNIYMAHFLNTFETGMSLYQAIEDADGNITWGQIVYTP